jgi:hypothetical protein
MLNQDDDAPIAISKMDMRPRKLARKIPEAELTVSQMSYNVER